MFSGCTNLSLGFNPRICKRCDKVKVNDKDFVQVSIHASVKDATNKGMPCPYCGKVSIHASVKDATLII